MSDQRDRTLVLPDDEGDHLVIYEDNNNAAYDFMVFAVESGRGSWVGLRKDQAYELRDWLDGLLA